MSEHGQILVVEDDVDLLASIRACLERDHHVCDGVGDGGEAVDMLKYTEYDVIILDIQLPTLSGIEILRSYRQAMGTSSVILLTSRSQIDSKLEGLDSGADDYLTKPFDFQELSARVRAQLRRRHQPYETILKAGDLELDTEKFIVRKAGVVLKFKPKEFAVLEFFMRHPDQVFSAEALLLRIWPSDSEASPDGLRVHITKIRSQIDTPGSPSFIETVHRLGYRFLPR